MIKPPDLDVQPEDQVTIAEIMQSHGYPSLKKTQAFAFNNGILDDGNNLLVAETGNGKTLTAEAVTLKELKQGNRVAYLVPSTQLVWAKKEAIEEWASPDYAVYSGRNKYRSADVAVGTFESFYQAIIQGVDGVRSIDTIVLDDFHELYSGFRGSSIELAISAALYNDISIFGISATIGNPDSIGEWMNADVLISPEERQTPIKEFAIDSSTNSTKQKVIDTVADNKEKAPFLVFCFAKSWTESRAAALAEADIFEGPSPERDLRKEFTNCIEGVMTSTHRELLEMLRSGVGYIHSDLPGEIKRYILDLYENGELQALTTTTSLAYGFDSPVQSVIIADIKRRGDYVGVFEYIQWAGRAARPRFSYDCGYCYTLADDTEEASEKYFEETRELEPIETHIDNKEKFRWVLLELIANGWDSTEQMEEFLRETLYYEQMSTKSGWEVEHIPRDDRLIEILKETTDWLIEEGFIAKSETWSAFSPTHLGRGAVNFHYNSWTDANLLQIKAFYNWAEEGLNADTNQLNYIHTVSSYFKINLSNDNVEGRLEPTLREYGYSTNNESITAGIIRWYWMRNYSIEQIEQETGVDPTYLPNLARRLSDTTEATQYIIEAAPNANLPEWFDNMVYRIDKGVLADETPIVSGVSTMGRTKVRFLRGYLKQMAHQTLEIEPENDLWTLLTEFYDHTSGKEQFESIIAEQVNMTGPVTAKNISKYIDENEHREDPITTPEETAMEIDTDKDKSNITKKVNISDENTLPTSLRDF